MHRSKVKGIWRALLRESRHPSRGPCAKELSLTRAAATNSPVSLPPAPTLYCSSQNPVQLSACGIARSSPQFFPPVKLGSDLPRKTIAAPPPLVPTT
jgi:hypothetical protein